MNRMIETISALEALAYKTAKVDITVRAAKYGPVVFVGEVEIPTSEEVRGESEMDIEDERVRIANMLDESVEALKRDGEPMNVIEVAREMAFKVRRLNRKDHLPRIAKPLNLTSEDWNGLVDQVNKLTARMELLRRAVT